jgi:hypothetical protein
MKNDEPRIAPERRHLLACDALIQPPPSTHDLTFADAPEPWLCWCTSCQRGFRTALEYLESPCSGKDTPCAP